jgi:hypothetical protein
MIKALTIEGDAWRKEIPLGTRVLAGASREWTFDLAAKSVGPWQVRVDTSAGMFAGDIPAPFR